MKVTPLMLASEIIYCGFYDYPLAFVVRHRNALLLFWREFDDALDDYSDTYEVFLLPDFADEEVKVMRVWDGLPERATRRLGEVPVKDIVFDPTRRREIGTAVLDALMSREAAFA